MTGSLEKTESAINIEAV